MSTFPTVGSMPGGESNAWAVVEGLTVAVGRAWAAALSLRESALSNLVSAGLDERWLGPAAGRLVGRSPWHWLSIEAQAASRRGIRAPLQRLLNEGATSTLIARRFKSGRLSQWSGLVHLGDDYSEWVGRLGRRGVGVEARNVAGGIWTAKWRAFRARDFIAGLGADLFVGGLWQLGEDALFHPEVFGDWGLVGRRVGAASFTNTTNGAIGWFATAAAFSLFSFSTGGAGFVVAGIGAAIIVDVTHPGQWIEDKWFDLWDANLP